MGIYRYRAVDRGGDIRVGHIEAGSLQQAAERLSGSALLPLQLREAAGILAGPAEWLRKVRQGRRVTRRDVALMTQQLASLARAGLTLDRSLAIAVQLAQSPAQRRLLHDLSQRVRRGASFTEALEAHRASFPGYYLSMVRAGETGGAMADILTRLSQLQTRSQATRERVQSALIYPTILLCMIGFTLILIITFVLPRFNALFVEAGAQLPLPTRAVMALGTALRNYSAVLAAALAGLLLWLHRLGRDAAARLRFDDWLLRRRVIGTVIAEIDSARFARTLGTLIAGGLPVPAGLRISRGALVNTALQAAADAVLIGVSQGQAFAERLAQCGRFPMLLVQMARVGEETGRLHQELLEAAEMLDAAAQRDIERGLSVLIPLITIGMGALVAALIGSVLVGILSVNELAL